MMGTHHALCGAAAWIAVTSPSVIFPNLGLYPMEPGHVALGAVLAAGAALLPDIDHHNATIAHSIPVVGKVVTGAVGAASGGHRHGTHSGLSAIIVALIAVISLRFDWSQITSDHPAAVIAGLIAMANIAFAVKVLKIVRNWGLAWLIGFAMAGLITWLIPEQWAWLGLTVAVGWIAHMAGDFLTTGGLPLFWPFKPKPSKAWSENPLLDALWSRGGYFAFPILGNAGSWREWWLLVPIGGYALMGTGHSLLMMVPHLNLT